MTNENRHVIVPMPWTIVPGGESVGVRDRCTCVFKPTHLVVPRHLTPSFNILDFKIGKNSQLMGDGPAPAACFSGDLVARSLSLHPEDFLEEARLDVPLSLRLDLVTPDHDLYLLVHNITASALNFYCVLYGTLIE